jgi:hypothetical protein
MPELAPVASVDAALAENVGSGALSAAKMSELAAANSCCAILAAAFCFAASKVCANEMGPANGGRMGDVVCAAKEKLVRQTA